MFEISKSILADVENQWLLQIALTIGALSVLSDNFRLNLANLIYKTFLLYNKYIKSLGRFYFSDEKKLIIFVAFCYLAIESNKNMNKEYK